MNEHVTLIAPSGEDAFARYHRFTLRLPFATRAERYTRSLAMHTLQRRQELRRARVKDSDMTLLVPATDLDEETAQEIHGGTVVGVRMQVVDGINAPMIAYPIECRELPY